MSFDGVFINHLVKELKSDLIANRINKVNCIDKMSFTLNLKNRKDLLISLNADSSHIRLTEQEYIASTISFPLLTLLKKYLESSTILDFYQHQNDRVCLFKIESHNELGYKKIVYLILELFGRNSNLIIADENLIVIDCFKKTFVLNDNDKRILVPKHQYQFIEDNRINPFTTDILYDTNIYQGVSKLLYSEITIQNNLELIKQKTKPQIINVGNKFYYYCFDLLHLNGEVKYYSSLSSMLEEYFLKIKQENILNSEQKQVENYLTKELNKTNQKLINQENDLKKAYTNIELDKIGNLLSANLYQLKKGMDKIIVNDFYNDNQEITINLNKDLSPSKNLEQIFSKYKKAKRSIKQIEEQIIYTKYDIKYLETLEQQLKISKVSDLKEIIEELKLAKTKQKPKKKTKPQITTFNDYFNNTIFVGKNNFQNNYLTHTLANKNDYFFHVKDIPGSHTILRCEELTEEIIYLTGMIAAYYSKSRASSNVAVDYTLVRNVRKVPKTKGSFVTYTNQKTVYVTPDYDYIKKHTN